MKIPLKIKIGGHQYEIKVIDGDVSGMSEAGLCYRNNHIIFINKADFMDESAKNVTLFHEIIEAINYNYELKLPHQAITILAETIYQVLIDNKLLNKRT